jgi:FkbM family methyltransferase
MYYAEVETDKYIREKFFLDENENMVMIEVGGGPPEFYSMSKHFRDSGWRAISIDPNPKFVQQHKTLGNEIYQYACSNECKNSKFTIVNTSWDQSLNGISYSSLGLKYSLDKEHDLEEIDVQVVTLNKLLNDLKIKKIDFLSVDTEGWELEVLQGLDTDTYNIKIILLENYLHLETYNEYMKNIGYSLDNKIEYNYIYIKEKKNF